MKKFYFLILFIFFSINPVWAQNGLDVSVKVSPNIPEPNERVVVSLESFGVNLSDSTIRWFIKKQIVKEGVGVTSISFIAPSEDLQIIAQIQTPEGTEIVRQIFISASSVDLLWEAPDTYAPPFYKGKALPGPESLVKFVAIPSAAGKIGQQASKSVDFIWSVDGENVGSSSGKGKESFTVIFDSLKDSQLIGVASNSFGKIASAEMTIKPFDLNLSVYPISSGGEPFITRALRSGDLINKETAFFAAPYGAHPRYLDSKNISFSWKIAGSSVKPSGRPYLATITSGAGLSESLSISYEIARSLFKGFERTYRIEI